MKIAVASDQQGVSAHFGYCESFTIFATKEGRITATEVVANPGHRPGFLPRFLNDLGVNVIISGGMGSNAIRLFQEQGITVMTGAVGDPKKVVQDYLSSKGEPSAEACREHKH